MPACSQSCRLETTGAHCLELIISKRLPSSIHLVCFFFKSMLFASSFLLSFFFLIFYDYRKLLKQGDVVNISNVAHDGKKMSMSNLRVVSSFTFRTAFVFWKLFGTTHWQRWLIFSQVMRGAACLCLFVCPSGHAVCRSLIRVYLNGSPSRGY